MSTWPTKIRRFFASNWFLAAILLVFTLEASWIALVGRYPMAFDESYHFGIIQIYSHQLSPFIRHEPAGASVYGDITRYPSYLYHYLLSFPYRLIEKWTTKTADQIVALRFINIVLFGVGIWLWQKVLRRLQASAAVTNVILAVFVLIPQVPFLAAQNNYDNLLMPLIALSVLLGLIILQHWSTDQNLTMPLGYLLGVSMLASLVMYSFLPIFAGFILYFGWRIGRKPRQFWQKLQNGWHDMSSAAKTIMILFLVLATGLFGERYGVNLVKFHALVPDCSKVLGTQTCLNYSPWARNYGYVQAGLKYNISTFYKISFIFYWLYRMTYQLFFLLSPGFGTTAIYALPLFSATIVIGLGLVGLIKFRGQAKPTGFWLIVLTIIMYSAALSLLDLVEYIHLGVPVAIQGRYIIPLLPIIFWVVWWGAEKFFRTPKSRSWAAVILLILLLEGGGVLSWTGLGNNGFWWPQPTVQKVSHDAQTITRHVIVPWTVRPR